jgi:hypothetical protein
MLLLEGTEPEKESMTVRLVLGCRTSRIDEIAHILTTAGSKGDGQPYRKAGLSGLTGDVDLQQQDPMELMQVMGGGVNSREKKAERSQGARGEEDKGDGALGAVYRGRIHSWETEPRNPV